MKEKSWSEISESLKTTQEEIKTTWNSLRAQFGIEMKNVISIRSDQSTDDLYISQWTFYDKLLFLQPIMKTKKSRDTLINCDDDELAGNFSGDVELSSTADHVGRYVASEACQTSKTSCTTCWMECWLRLTSA